MGGKRLKKNFSGEDPQPAGKILFMTERHLVGTWRKKGGLERGRPQPG